jgi:hypothetical protein
VANGRWRVFLEVFAPAAQHMPAKIEALTNDNATAAGLSIFPSGKTFAVRGLWAEQVLQNQSEYCKGLHHKMCQPIAAATVDAGMASALMRGGGCGGRVMWI